MATTTHTNEIKQVGASIPYLKVGAPTPQEGEGEHTAGQLAVVVGLTTGAITGMLNRLEEAGLVRRERDKSDGRRVIVRLVRGQEGMQKVGSIFASLGQACDELASHYDEEQLAFLLEFLERSNALYRQEIVRLQEAPAGEKRCLVNEAV